jgi:tetratricopeptide (TPR) repeat protein
VAALVFAAHPVLVEPVAEVSSREDLLATFFLLTSVLLGWLWANGKARTWALVCSLLAVPLACGSKETGVAAPFLILLCGLLFRGEAPLRRWLVLSGGAFLLAVAFLIARFSLQPEVSEIFLYKPQYLGGSLEAVFKIQPFIWAFSIQSIFSPFGLSADYVAQNVLVMSKTAMVVTLALFLSAQGLAAWKSRVAAFGVAIFWLGLAPVSNFIPIYRPLADRYLYLPMVGLAIMLCGVLLLASRRYYLFTVLLAGVGCVVLALASLSVRRQSVFANSLNLWTDTFAKSPFSDTAANNLGYALLQKGDYKQALEIFDKAVRLTNGKKPNVWAGVAVTLEKLGRPIDAEAALDRAIALEAIYADPVQVVKSLLVTQEQADVMREILKRKALKSPAGGGVAP